MSEGHEESDKLASGIDKGLVARSTRFAISLLNELQREDENINMFISPLSISIALVMLYNGAESLTKDAMAEALQLKGMQVSDVNGTYRKMSESLKNIESSVSLTIGNSIWARKSFEPSIKDDYKQILHDNFSSELLTREFSDPQTVEEINQWVKRETGGKIEKYFDRLDRDASMLLINAVYFKGEWVKKFNESRTLQRSFTLSSGRRIKVDMMANTGNYLYYSGEGAQAARLPYGRGKIAMYVILPDEGTDLDSYVDELEQEKLDGIISRMIDTEIELQIPRLKLEYGKKQLNKALTRMGMGIAFNGAFADFRGIASVDPERLFVSSVDHKAVVEVNEKGTEAAAVTSIGIRATSMIMTARRFVVNRPYLFLIRDDRSGLILFMGKILDPTKAKPQ